MRSTKAMNIHHLNLNDKKDKLDGKKSMIDFKKKSLEIPKPQFKKNSLELQKLKAKKNSMEISFPRNKKNSMEISFPRIKKNLLEISFPKNKRNSLELQKPREKKNSLEYNRPRNSKASNRYGDRKKKSIHSLNSSYLAYNNIANLDNSRDGNSSNDISQMDYIAMGEEIKYTLLEMKNNCLMEINDGLDVNKENKKKEEFDEDLTNSAILKSLGNNEFNKNSKILKLKKSLTKEELNSSYQEKKEKYLKLKKFNTKNNFITNRNYKRATIKEKFDIKKDMKSLIEEKFRIYRQGGQIEDSYNESESDEEGEPDSFLINPETYIFFIYDTIIAILSVYSFVAISYQITGDCFCQKSNNKLKFFTEFFVDIFFFFDLIINFFLEFYTETNKLIKNRKKIISNYLAGWFFYDFLAAIPMNIIYYYYCKNYEFQICHTYERNGIVNTLTLLKCLKSIKIFKMPATKKNQFIAFLTELASDESSENVNLIIELFLVIFGLHILSCIHIFIGKHTYPGWIYANDFQNYSVLNLYMISVYYLITTMTTVGYGDISSDSFIEIIFRIILLAVGIICYSWLISNISNGINKQSYASINFSNECIILENIRLEHRDLPFKIYNEIKKHLEYKNFHQQIYDKNLLINSLPYSLKNNLIFSMYKLEIEKFIFFKGISNTNFISEVLYNFSPLICKKNYILLKENEIIEEIYFVREGGLCLELPINMDNPEESINEYLSKEFNNYAFNFSNQDNLSNIPKMIDSNISNKSLTSLLDEKSKNCFFSVIGDQNINLEQKEPTIFYLKIYDIHKNENYGGIYIHHGKRSPFEVKVKSKRVKLYVIKKDDYLNICETYKNFTQRIHKKEKKNIKQIKNILIKTIDRFCHTHGFNIKEEYKPIVEKAIKDFNKNSLPDFLKNNNAFDNLFTNEIDEEINKTIREFNTKLFKVSTTKTKFNIKALLKSKTKSKLTEQESIERKMLDNINKQRKSMNIQYRPKKKSYNFTIRGNLGANIIQSFRPIYNDDFFLARSGTFFNVDKINNKIYQKINDEKNRLNEIRKNKFENKLIQLNEKIGINEKNNINENNEKIGINENNNLKENDEINGINEKKNISENDEIIGINENNNRKENDEINGINEKKNISENDEIIGINETIKINKLKPVFNITNQSLKNYTFNNSDCEKESNKTIKIKSGDKESIGKDPITLNDLPELLKNKLKNRIRNNQMLTNIDNNFKIEHITIEINNYIDKTANYSNNNSLFDNSNQNTTNNMSYLNINRYKNFNKTFNSEVSQSISNNEKINLRNYTKSSSYNQNNNMSKKNQINGKTLKFNKKKIKKGVSNSVKNKEYIPKIKADYTNQNSTRLTLTPLYSSNIISQMNNTYNLSSKNKFKRSSFTDNKNIMSKINGELDKKSNLFIDDLSSTSVESFQIKRSYKNLNQESGGTYIKNKKMQQQTIKFIKEFENNKTKKIKKEKSLKERLTGNFDIQNLIKPNKEEDNQFKKLENAVRRVKTRMSNILLKKKRKTQKNLNQISNQRESLKANSPSPRAKKKKTVKTKFSLNSFKENYNYNSSNLQLNNLSINADDTLSKLNLNNNEIIKMDFQDDINNINNIAKAQK